MLYSSKNETKGLNDFTAFYVGGSIKSATFVSIGSTCSSYISIARVPRKHVHLNSMFMFITCPQKFQSAYQSYVPVVYLSRT